jgi:hypothetical protein
MWSINATAALQTPGGNVLTRAYIKKIYAFVISLGITYFFPKSHNVVIYAKYFINLNSFVMPWKLVAKLFLTRKMFEAFGPFVASFKKQHPFYDTYITCLVGNVLRPRRVLSCIAFRLSS